MAEYIEREEIYKRWNAMPAPASVASLSAAIQQTPAADVAPVRHGNWDSSGKYMFVNGELAIRCSECGCSLRQEEYEKFYWNYCPVCAAQRWMEVSEND